MGDSSFFHALSIQETFSQLDTSPEGLSQKEAEKRLATYGKNLLKQKTTSVWTLFFRQFNNLFIYILFAASLVSILVQEWGDFFVINTIILINGLIAFWQELKARASLEALKKLTESQNKVVRDGKLVRIASSFLVPGDYLVLHEGDLITADVRLVESSGLMVDEASLTGESLPILKKHDLILDKEALPYELTNSLLAGTSVVRGSAKGVVVNTGENSYLASIAEKGQEPSPDSPLMRSLRFFAQRYAIVLVGWFVCLGLIGYLQGRDFLDMAYMLMAALVSAVPEGLPIVMTLVMVIGAMKLSQKKAIVRYLPAVETLGVSTVIASDKTGTITEGKLVVKEVFATDLEKVKWVAALCNDAHAGSGDPLDVALAHWVDDDEMLKKNYPRKWEHAFDAQSMLMATAHEIEGKEYLLVKGAYEALKEKVEGQENLGEIETALTNFLQQGLRVLALAVGGGKEGDMASWKMRIVGLMGFIDPPKAYVREAVLAARQAGIRILMITGDHPETAKSIAEQVGIWGENERVLTGKELASLPDNELLEAIKSTSVLARSLPEHKYRVVKLLQQDREVVSVTGDGVNDVPALKAADIGIAMGNGTEAAKSAAEMVITDNNLTVIVDAIKNARIISDNLRKVIYYLLSTSFQEIILISLSMITNYPIPLSAIQILWINIVTDGVQDKTFAFAKEEGDVMKKKPRLPEKQFFDKKQIFNICFFAITMGLALYLLYIYLFDRYPLELVSTLVFNSLVMVQWANGIQAQKDDEPFFKNIHTSLTINPFIYWGLAAGLVLQYGAIYLFPQWTHSIPLPPALWIYPLSAFFTSFGVVELRKWIALKR